MEWEYLTSATPFLKVPNNLLIANLSSRFAFPYY